MVEHRDADLPLTRDDYRDSRLYQLAKRYQRRLRAFGHPCSLHQAALAVRAEQRALLLSILSGGVTIDHAVHMTGLSRSFIVRESSQIGLRHRPVASLVSMGEGSEPSVRVIPVT